MCQVIVLKHVRLAKAFHAVEAAAQSLDTELLSLRALRGAGLPDLTEEAAMLRAYVRTLTVLLQAMPAEDLEGAGLRERHAKSTATVERCADSLGSFFASVPTPVALGTTG